MLVAASPQLTLHSAQPCNALWRRRFFGAVQLKDVVSKPRRGSCPQRAASGRQAHSARTARRQRVSASGSSMDPQSDCKPLSLVSLLQLLCNEAMHLAGQVHEGQAGAAQGGAVDSSEHQLTLRQVRMSTMLQ